MAFRSFGKYGDTDTLSTVAMAYRSWFSYGISRPYPLRWFTPVVCVGAVIAIALVSFINVAATGYELVPTSTPDPNGTESNSLWFSKWPSYLVGAQASCDPTTIPIQNTIYTDKKAFPYTLGRVWQTGGDGVHTYQGSLIYKNNPIQSCNITKVQIQFEGPDRTAGQLEIITVGGTVTTTTECYIDAGSPSGRTYFQLIATYDAIPPPNLGSTTFLTLNKTTEPSMFWGYSMLNVYWRTVMQDFFNENMKRTPPPFFKGTLSLHRNTTLPGTIEEQVTSPEFLFVRACYFIPLNSTGVAYLQSSYCNTSSITELAASTPAFERPLPGIWRSVGTLGKSMWFTVLADLGRNDALMPNMFAQPDLLANLTANLTQANLTLSQHFRQFDFDSNIFLQSFDPSQPLAVPLKVNQSVLTTDYLCQVPQLKSGGNLFVSVLVADLAILQGIWAAFTFLVGWFWVKNGEEAESCAVCAAAAERPKSEETIRGGYKSVAKNDSEMEVSENPRSISP